MGRDQVKPRASCTTGPELNYAIFSVSITADLCVLAMDTLIEVEVYAKSEERRPSVRGLNKVAFEPQNRREKLLLR